MEGIHFARHIITKLLRHLVQAKVVSLTVAGFRGMKFRVKDRVLSKIPKGIKLLKAVAAHLRIWAYLPRIQQLVSHF